MKKTLLYLVTVIVAVALGFTVGRHDNDSNPSGDGGSSTPERDILYWVAPMDPNYRRDEPGQSPMGMDLVPVYADEVDAVPGTVTIDPTVVNNLGVRSEPVERGPLPRLVETVGYVNYDEETLQHVHTRVDGWIEKLAVTANGDPVKQGE